MSHEYKYNNTVFKVPSKSFDVQGTFEQSQLYLATEISRMEIHHPTRKGWCEEDFIFQALFPLRFTTMTLVTGEMRLGLTVI